MKREEMTRKAWLLFLNRTLREQGVISEQDYRRLKNKIVVKYTSPSLTKTAQRGG